MLQDALRQTPAYQRILQEGREEEREALQKVLQQQQEALQQQRDLLLDVMLERFPLLARRARDYAKAVDDLAKLSRLSVKMAMAPTAEEAERILRDVEKGDKETN